MSNKVSTRKCSVPDCGRKHRAKGFCFTHYTRYKKHGDAKPSRPVTKSKFGSENGRWKGGVITDGHGRVLIYSPNHPNPSSLGTYVYRYRLVMEERLGRYLKSNEIVHHKNGNHADDRIENLEVMSQSEHCKAHKFGGNRYDKSRRV